MKLIDSLGFKNILLIYLLINKIKHIYIWFYMVYWTILWCFILTILFKMFFDWISVCKHYCAQSSLELVNRLPDWIHVDCIIPNITNPSFHKSLPLQPKALKFSRIKIKSSSSKATRGIVIKIWFSLCRLVATNKLNLKNKNITNKNSQINKQKHSFAPQWFCNT